LQPLKISEPAPRDISSPEVQLIRPNTAELIVPVCLFLFCAASFLDDAWQLRQRVTMLWKTTRPHSAMSFFQSHFLE
jgi:hypothetical protein